MTSKFSTWCWLRPEVRKIRWRHIAIAVYILIFVTSLTVAIFGQVDAAHHTDDIAWTISTWMFVGGSVAAVYSIFSRGNYYLRVGLMAAPFFMRGTLYVTTPESLPKQNEWAASSINMLCGVLIVLLEAFDTDDIH